MSDNGFSFFGFELKRKKETEVESFVSPMNDDGALNVATAAGGAYASYVDLDGAASTEAELINQYRELSLQPEMEDVIDQIVNEAIAIDEADVVTINLDAIKNMSNKTKDKIRDAFDEVKQVTDINNIGFELFRRFYIDGRLKFHIIPEDNPNDGIREIRYIDPRKIRKVREIEKTNKGEAIIQTVKKEYYIYNDMGYAKTKGAGVHSMGGSSTTGLKIEKDSIIDVSSGLMNETNTLVLSYLHKAIRPMNQLRTLEDSVVIYRIARAPERRVFYIDTGNLPKAKAEQYLRDMMTRHKNKLVYDAATGQVRDDRKHMTMLEDYWLPRRGDSNRGTEISSLSGGQNLGEMEDVKYFKRKLWEALDVPISRLDENSGGFNIGRQSQITRDELNFQKLIYRLRKKFSALFLQALERQLVLKKILTVEEWEDIKSSVYFEYAMDNHFTEMKNLDILQARIEALNNLRDSIGTFYSEEWVRKNVLMQTDDEIKEIDKQIKSEGSDEDDDADGFGIPDPQNAAPAPKQAQTYTLAPTQPQTPAKAAPKPATKPKAGIEPSPKTQN